MKNFTSIADLPNVPAVYAMYGGRGRGLYVAYVGMGEKLRQRVTQHLVRRDSSVVTGVSAVALIPDLVTEVRWWEHPDLAKDDASLQAAELIAFEVLEPALRSRGAVQDQAKQLLEDSAFREKMLTLFRGDPAGRLVIQTLQDALERIAELEQRLAEVEKQLPGKQQP
jgi:hypothetical protein